MSKFQTLLKGLLGKAYKIPAEEIADLLEKSEEEINEQEVLTKLISYDTTRMESFRNRIYGESAKKTEAKTRKEFVDKLREKFELDAALDGDDLFDAIDTKVAERIPKNSSLTDDLVKAHPLYLQAETTFKKQLNETKRTYEDQISAIQREHQKAHVWSKVFDKAGNIFDGLNPILSQQQDKASTQRKVFLDRFSNYDWEEVEGNFFPVKEGKRMEDSHGHALSLESLVKSEADTMFDFKKAEERQTPPKPGEKQNQQPAYSGALPKTTQEYETMMQDKTLSLADKKVINNHWLKASGAMV